MSGLPSLTAAVLRVLASRVVRIGFVVAAVGLGALAVVREWNEVRGALEQLSLLATGLSTLAAIGGLVTGMLAWRHLLAALGSPLPLLVAARMLFVSVLGKYLPGSVWPMVAQMEIGRSHGVPRLRSATAFVLVILFSLTTALLTGTATLPIVIGTQLPAFRWVFLLIPVLLVVHHPRVLNPLLDTLLRLAKRPLLERPLGWGASLAAAGMLVVQWVLFGLHIATLAVDLGADPFHVALPALGGFALAWALGPLVLIAPAGVGVRELMLVAALSPFLGAADALVVAVTSRALMAAVDLLLAGLSVLGSRGKRNAPGVKVFTT